MRSSGTTVYNWERVYTMLRDPVCGKKVNRNKVQIKIKRGNEIYYLCCPLCQKEFERNPEKYLRNIRQAEPAR